jgi:hypothetical protein
MKPLFTVILLGAAVTLVADQKLGQPLTAQEPLPLAAVFGNPDLVGKTVQVRGKVVEVCEMMGCWMNLTDDQGHLVRIKVDDGVLVFPKEAVGRNAIAEGKLEKRELTKAQVIAEAKKEADEAHRKFKPASVKSGRTVYTIAGTGAVILDQ